MSKSTTNNHQQVINSPDQKPNWDEYDKEVRKIVLGPSPGTNDSKPLHLDGLPADFAARFPNLTHLNLWRLEGLKTLPTLPVCLQCLDLRGCADLTALPALPNTLETLDLGQCAKLEELPTVAPTSLNRFYFNGCTSLDSDSLGVFMKKLQGQAIFEIDGSATLAVKSLAKFPTSVLRKLVLKDCPNLTDAAGIGNFQALEHLNLGGCSALTSLPDLPPHLRYLVLHGSENLTSFMCQNIGPYDRGTENQNVAKALLSRKKFGKELAIMPHAKLLLMGDGRVGKTTLAKRLQWEEIEDKDRKIKTNKDRFQPRHNEPFTHKVCFSHWKTGLRLPENEQKDLNDRCLAANIELPRTKSDLLVGSIRIWDFGGQEIYHHTHRIFAGEGSIFLLVWREQAPELENAPKDVTPEEWQEWNRQRPLDYWLDYIYSMRDKAQVAMVCTDCKNPDIMSTLPNWKSRAPKYKNKELPSFWVDSLDDLCGQHKEYQRLVNWIREACGREACRIGILQPRFYCQVNDMLDSWLRANNVNRRNAQPLEHLLCPWNKWRESVCMAHKGIQSQAGPELEEDDIATITDYLHQAGHLFQIRHNSQRAILVDQEWAAELIYRLLLCGGKLREIVKSHGGWLYLTDLEADPLWKDLENDDQRKRLLAFMQECLVIVRIADAKHQRDGKEIYLASDKWLLPEYEKVEDQVERRMELVKETVRDQNGLPVQEKFEFEELTMSEFDFRSLQAMLARTFGTRGIYFRTGFQAQENDNMPDWCFRLRWLPDEKDPFVGKIDAVLFARRRQLDFLGVEIEDLFYAEGSPIAQHRRKIVHKDLKQPDLNHEYFRMLRQDEYDVGVSSSGGDSTTAESMVDAMRVAGLKVIHYKLPECRSNECERVMDFMRKLGRQRCIVLLISDGYLTIDAENNWYCAWELADAIIRLGKEKNGRTSDQTLVVFKEDANFSFSQFNKKAHQLLNDMADHFFRAYGALGAAESENFKYYDDFKRHFLAAIKSENWTKFTNARGSLGAAINYNTLPTLENGEKDFSSIITKLKNTDANNHLP